MTLALNESTDVAWNQVLGKNSPRKWNMPGNQPRNQTMEHVLMGTENSTWGQTSPDTWNHIWDEIWNGTRTGAWDQTWNETLNQTWNRTTETTTSNQTWNQSWTCDQTWNPIECGQLLTHEQLTFIRFYDLLWKVIAPVIFIIIIIVGATGNLLVAYVIVSNPRMRSVTNLLLLNLASCDLAYLFICVPSTTYKFIADSFEFSNFVCQLVQFLSYVSSYVAIYTLVAISVIRYLTIVHSNVTTICSSPSTAILFAASLWIFMMAVNIPTFLVHTKKTFDNYTYCGMEPGSIGPVIITFFIFAYALPLSIICILYLRIVHYLRSRKPATFLQRRARERNARTLRLIALVVVSFGVAWLPYHVNSLLSRFGQLPPGFGYEIFRIVTMCMSFGNSCINPFIYNCAAEEFRADFKRVVCRCRRRNDQSEKSKQSRSENSQMTHIG